MKAQHFAPIGGVRNAHRILIGREHFVDLNVDGRLIQNWVYTALSV